MKMSTVFKWPIWLIFAFVMLSPVPLVVRVDFISTLMRLMERIPCCIVVLQGSADVINILTDYDCLNGPISSSCACDACDACPA